MSHPNSEKTFDTKARLSYRANSTPASGFKGVKIESGKYKARIFYDGKEHRIGTFLTGEEAHAAYLMELDKLQESKKKSGELVTKNTAPRKYKPMTEARKEKAKIWAGNNKDKCMKVKRGSALRLKYGMTHDEFDMILSNQSNKCAICKIEFFGKNAPVVDHDHSSGWVRGLLCQSCNIGLGGFRDNIESLLEAVEYLISTATPTEFNIDAQISPLKMKPARPAHTEERKKATSERAKGNKYRQGLPAWNKGKAWSEETKEKMRKPKKKKDL